MTDDQPTEPLRIDQNVTFTQASSTVWEVVASETGAVIGRVERDGDTWVALNQGGTPLGKYPSAEAGMFSMVALPEAEQHGENPRT